MTKLNITKAVFCRVAWMKRYEGATEYDIPIGGGKHVEKYGRAFEEYNFLGHKESDDAEEKVYGYVWGDLKSKNIDPTIKRALNLTKLDPALGGKVAYIDDVTVIFFATRPEQGQFIVGWYKNATVYRELQLRPDKLIYDVPDDPPKRRYRYFFETKKSDSHLIIEHSKRNHQIFHGDKSEGTYRPNVYYYSPQTHEWMDEALAYVNDPDNNKK